MAGYLLTPDAPRVPLHFMADYCLRCGTPFADGQRCPLVMGGPAAKYRQIALLIDEACLGDPALDIPVLWVIPRYGVPTCSRFGEWPHYLGPRTPLQGFAKVNMLDNGLAMVGLHRGHVEYWRRREVREYGGVLGSYSADYQLYGGGGLELYHRVIEARFYDLATPLPLTGVWPEAENRFIRGAVTPQRRVFR